MSLRSKATHGNLLARIVTTSGWIGLVSFGIILGALDGGDVVSVLEGLLIAVVVASVTMSAAYRHWLRYLQDKTDQA